MNKLLLTFIIILVSIVAISLTFSIISFIFKALFYVLCNPLKSLAFISVLWIAGLMFKSLFQ